MGSCVSFSRSPPPASTTTAEESKRAVAAAKVVNLDGSMAQFAVPAVTAREALMSAVGDKGGRSSPRLFLCSSDELGFDAPTRALAAHEALQPGQLYFVLPASVLRRPLSGEDMAALAVKAATALAVEAGLVAGGTSSSPQRRKRRGGPAGKGRRQSTARVAPLLVVSSQDGSRPDGGSWNNNGTTPGGFATPKTEHDGINRTAGKARQGGGRRSGARRRPGGAQRLSAIAEDGE